MTPIRILIVDDHPIIREGFESMVSIEADMIVVGSVSSGREAIEMYPKLQADLTVMDLSLPDMDGVEAMSAIRRGNPEARFVVLSASRREQDVFRAIKGGASSYVFKSAASTELIGAIRSVWAGKRYLPAEVATRAVAAVGADVLTTRELQILQLIAAGEDNAAIAVALSIHSGTVKNHVHHILAKLGARTRTHAVAVALQRGLVKQVDD